MNLEFRKSSHCDALDQEGCVEVAHAGEAVAVRDSTDPNSPVLMIGRKAWAALAGRL